MSEHASESTSGEPPPSPEITPPQITSAQIIGQATAVLAVAAAVIYAAGGLSLGLKLWYDQFPWAPVLGQLPKGFLLVNAIVVVAFAIVIGLAAYSLYKGQKGLRDLLSSRGAKSWALSVVAAAVLACLPLVFLLLVRRTTIHGVIRPYWQVFLACLVLNFVFIRIALYLLPKINVQGLQEILGVAVLAFAFVPVVASIQATFRFPVVALCGPEFSNHGTHSRYAIGNLIGTSGQWIYVSEAVTSSSKPPKFLGSYIAVIPLSAVRLESIGSITSCGDLRAPVTRAG